tara:strand:+ start:2541 stop:3482 length:942 start_codon:yes stop_codon:yes gene_type:complete
MIGTSMMGDLAPGASMLELDPSPGDVGITTDEQGRIIDPYAAQSIDKTKKRVIGFDSPSASTQSWVNSLMNSGFDPFAQDADQPQAMAPRPSFRERRAARPSFRERRAPRRTQRQAYRQAGGRPVMDWIIGGGDKQWSNKADRRGFFKNLGLRAAGIMNPALALPIMGYQMYEGMKNLDPSERRQFLAKNLMFGGLGRRFGPGSQALGGIMALRQGAPAKSILSNLLVANAPRGYRDIAGGIASMMGDTSGKRTWGQTARNVGRGRTYGYLAQQFGNQLYKQGVNRQYIPMIASGMAKKATQGLGKVGPWGPG